MRPSGPAPTILIVEDESSIADSLRYALSTEGFEPHCCATGETALELFASIAPAVVILDVGLPDMSGFDLCRQLRTFSAVPILFLTARAEEIDRVLGLELGGDDYVTKPFSPREVVARVRAILRRSSGQLTAPTGIASRFLLDDERKRVMFRGAPLDLSRYEYRLLSVLLKRPGRVYSRELLMSIAWESPEMSLERTVDTHIKTIRAKLRALDPEDDSIVTHRGIGYSLREDS